MRIRKFCMLRVHIVSSLKAICKTSIVVEWPRSMSSKMSSSSSPYNSKLVGVAGTLAHRIYIEHDGKPISPFHDIPMKSADDPTVLNMIVEIPRWSQPKYEISRNERFNPIKQDVKDGKVRYVKNLFPYHGYIWNYGALPRTWEDPSFKHPDTKTPGDNDPLDACEIGEAIAYPGEVKQVKVLGTICLLDGGETDWKIIVIDVKDPMADKLNDIDDVQTHMPGLMDATRDWFRTYKVPDGKKPNDFAMHGQYKDKKYANDIIKECSEAWERLITGKATHDGISLVNTTRPDTPGYVKESKSDDERPGEGDGKNPDTEPPKWHYVPRSTL